MHGQIAVSLNRKGRKRKSGRRQSDGRRIIAHPDFRTMAANNPDRRGLPEAHRLDERAGTVLGRLNLIRRIHKAQNTNWLWPENMRPGVSDHEYEAGLKYAQIVGAYLSMAGAPNGLSGHGKGYDCGGAANCPPESCICLDRTERYTDAYEAISRNRSPHEAHRMHMAINWTAIQDNTPSEDQMPHLRAGLNVLARHFGLIGKGRH